MSGTASLWEAVSVAAASLRSNKLRSFLTLLGIILATTTLIAVMSVIHGMDVYIAETVSDMGVDGFRVDRFPVSGQFDPKKFVEMLRKNPELTPEEFEFVRSRAKLVSVMGMQASRRISVACSAEQIDDVLLSGVSPNIAAITNTRTALGRFFVDSDDRRRLPLAFIGNDIKEKCFPSTDPIGKIVRLEGRPFEVIGVARAMGSVFGQSRDAFVMIPIQTYFKMYGSRRGIRYAGKAIGPEYLYQAQDEVRMLMRAWRHLRPGQEDNFGIFSSDTLVERWNQLTGAIAATAIGVVSVFMVVGGVVIMNIMMAVVTERTHEIGLLKSLGASRRWIMRIVLQEAFGLGVVGTLLGMCVSQGAGVLLMRMTSLTYHVGGQWILIAALMGVGSCLLGSLYPAFRAARLDPVVALAKTT